METSALTAPHTVPLIGRERDVAAIGVQLERADVRLLTLIGSTPPSSSTRGETAMLKQRHALFFMALAEEAEPGLRSPDQVAWLKRRDHEHANFRAALDWALRHGEAQIAGRIAGALWRFWYMQGFLAKATTG